MKSIKSLLKKRAVAIYKRMPDWSPELQNTMETLLQGSEKHSVNGD